MPPTRQTNKEKLIHQIKVMQQMHPTRSTNQEKSTPPTKATALIIAMPIIRLRMRPMHQTKQTDQSKQ